MKRNLEININGTAYSCRLTMGAMLRFKEITGHEVSEFDGSTLDLCAVVWSLVASAAKREGKKFDMEFWDFCDNVDPDEMARCWADIQAQQPEAEDDADGEKKSL